MIGRKSAGESSMTNSRNAFHEALMRIEWLGEATEHGQRIAWLEQSNDLFEEAANAPSPSNLINLQFAYLERRAARKLAESGRLIIQELRDEPYFRREWAL